MPLSFLSSYKNQAGRNVHIFFNDPESGTVGACAHLINLHFIPDIKFLHA